LGSDSDIDGDFSSGSDSDFNLIVVEEANDLDAEFMFEVYETENSAEVTTNSFSLKCRKRMRNEGNWARNDRKKNEIWDWFI